MRVQLVAKIAAAAAIVAGWGGCRTAIAEPADLAAALGPLLEQHAAEHRSTVALRVVDLDAEQTLFDRNGAQLLVPASNLKIYTAACALDLFGPDHRFVTTLQARGELADGVLTGDLVLVGGGDAMLTHQQLAKFARLAVEKWQLREVRGHVRGDNSRYGSPLKGPGWMWDDDPDYYNMSVTPLMVDFNVLTAKLARNDAGNPALHYEPPSAAPPSRVEPIASGGKPSISREPFTETIVGVAPDGPLAPLTKSLTMHDPGPWAAGMLRNMLKDAGCAFTEPDAASDSSEDAAARPVSGKLLHPGPPLAETLAHFLRASENAVGEALLHEIALHQGAQHPRWRDGAAAITAWLHKNAGLADGSFRLVDGSGLSRYNLISAESAVRLLGRMHRHEHGSEFFDALTHYDLQGATDDDAQVVIAAKSGGMQSVSTISGYVRTRDGRLLAFSLLVNGYIGSSQPVMELRQQVWRILAEYEPPVAE